MRFSFFSPVILFGCAWVCLVGSSQEVAPLPPIEGRYQVVEITAKERVFWTIFRKEGERNPSLAIKTQVKPTGLHPDQTYELRAEILRRSEKMIEASQLVVFFSTQQGKTPVCLLSTEQPIATFTGRLIDYDHPGFLTL